MRGVLRHLLITIFSVLVLQIYAQNIYKLHKQAEETFYEENFKEAATYYQQVIELNPEFEDVVYKNEICMLLSDRQYTDQSAFLAYEEEMSKSDKFFYYWKGRVQLEAYMFEEAVASLRTFIDRPERKSNIVISEAKKWIEEATAAKKYLDNPEDYEVHLLHEGINTEYAELSPVFFSGKEELLFLSDRDATKPDQFLIYHTRHEGDRAWSSPTVVRDVGTFTRDNANIEVVAEDGRLFQFRSKKGGDLFYSEPTDSKNGWSTPQEFDSKITSTHLSSHFFINEHEDRILFAKDVGSGKKPNLDLFESYRDPETGKWSKPSPFASNINTPYAEDSPFMSADEKTLYFASNGHETMGGYDIFRSEFNEATNQWSEPVNLGFPINTPDDEIHFKLNPDQLSGYFTSNRLNTFGDYDIFFFWEVSTVRIKGRVLDGATNEPVANARIFFRPIEYLDLYYFSETNALGEYETDITADDIFKVELKYSDNQVVELAEFEIHATGGTSTTHIKDFYVGGPVPEDGEDSEIILASDMDREPVVVPTTPSGDAGSVVVPDENIDREIKYEQQQVENLVQPESPDLQSTGRKAILRNVYFEFDETRIRKESTPILNSVLQLLNQNPNLAIEIAGHTDNIGSKQVNLRVSNRRAIAVRNWLIEKGIDPSRLVAKGYGESQPMATNDDEFEGRELNRRIELIVAK
ncbi:MAG: OmpA family protein [Bacteroidota bacterium]